MHIGCAPLEMSRKADASAPLSCASSLHRHQAALWSVLHRRHYVTRIQMQPVACLRVLARTLPFKCACSSIFFRCLQKLSCCSLMCGRFMDVITKQRTLQ